MEQDNRRKPDSCCHQIQSCNSERSVCSHLAMTDNSFYQDYDESFIENMEKDWYMITWYANKVYTYCLTNSQIIFCSAGFTLHGKATKKCNRTTSRTLKQSRISSLQCSSSALSPLESHNVSKHMTTLSSARPSRNCSHSCRCSDTLNEKVSQTSTTLYIHI